jgi:hypothetical protein
MNARQRHLETLCFGRPDSIPLEPGWGRKSTRAAWHTQGLPQEIDEPVPLLNYAFQQAGLKTAYPAGGAGFGLDQRMIPQFEEKVLELIPIWLEAGVNACNPIEVAAGNDLVDFRRKFGRNMAYRGGVDKRAMAKGGKAIEAEIRRLEPVIRDGGYIPGCDHGIPPDVSWPNFVHYVKLLAAAVGWT